MTTSDLPAFWTVIPTAGVGSHMCADCPKQHLGLTGRTVIERTLDYFLEHPVFRGLVVCLAEDDPYRPGLGCVTSRHVQRVVEDAGRAGSVLNDLPRPPELGVQANDWVPVHDVTRPSLTRGGLNRLLEELVEGSVGGLLAVPARDTLRHSDRSGRVSGTIDRSVVWLIYTSQMFHLGALYRALADMLVAGVAITDETSTMEWTDYASKLMEGRTDDLKITIPGDLLRLQRSFPHRFLTQESRPENRPSRRCGPAHSAFRWYFYEEAEQHAMLSHRQTSVALALGISGDPVDRLRAIGDHFQASARLHGHQGFQGDDGVVRVMFVAQVKRQGRLVGLAYGSVSMVR